MKALVVLLLVTLANLAGATSLIIPGGASGNASSLRDDIASCTGDTFLKRNAGDTAWECAGSTSSVESDVVFDALGDIVVGTGANTAVRLPKGTDGQILSTNSATVTDLEWITVTPGLGDALVANTLTQFAVMTSTSLLGEFSDETGTGVAVFSISPTLTTPVLGVATATSINGNAFPADNSTLVSVDDTQTITNKTISSASNVISADTVSSYDNMLGGDLFCLGLACVIVDGAVSVASLGNAVGDDGGDMITFETGAGWRVLDLGSAGQVLTVNGAGNAPEWSNSIASGDNVLVNTATTSDPDFVSTGDIVFVNTGNTITANVQQNTVALGTDTTGGYAASSSEGGAATTATALAANGADCSAGSAPLGVDASGAVASCFDVVTQVEGNDLAPIANPDFTGSLELPNGAPTLANDGDIATDVTANQLLYYSTALRVVTYVETECALITDTAAAADNRDVWMAPHAVTITSVACSCEGTCSTAATFTLEDRGGNAMTITGTNPTCSTSGNSTYAVVTAGNALVAGEKLNFDVTNTPDPETDEYLLCWTYTVDRQ